MTNALSPEARQAKIAKIRALLAKTTAAGATPDEADSARNMALSLQDKYGISASECQPEPIRRSAPTPPRGPKPAATPESDFFAWLFEEGLRQAQERHRQEQRAAAQAKADREAREAKARTSYTKRESADNFAPKSSTKPRTNGSHAFCDHEATSAARARCRKARA